MRCAAAVALAVTCATAQDPVSECGFDCGKPCMISPPAGSVSNARTHGFCQADRTCAPSEPTDCPVNRQGEPHECPQNSEWNDCGSACPDVCGEPPAEVCTEQCVTGCQCAEGFRRTTGNGRDRGVTSANQCIPEQMCPMGPGVPLTPPIITGRTPGSPCLSGAGFSWCEKKKRCLRIWEEPCDEADPDPMQLYGTLVSKTDTQVTISTGNAMYTMNVTDETEFPLLGLDEAENGARIVLHYRPDFAGGGGSDPRDGLLAVKIEIQPRGGGTPAKGAVSAPAGCTAARESLTDTGLLGTYVPQCDESDPRKWLPLQCKGSTAVCWCVEPLTGDKIPGANASACSSAPAVVIGGNDPDGCAHGYTWCAEEERCIRPWEDTCGGHVPDLDYYGMMESAEDGHFTVREGPHAVRFAVDPTAGLSAADLAGLVGESVRVTYRPDASQPTGPRRPVNGSVAVAVSATQQAAPGTVVAAPGELSPRTKMLRELVLITPPQNNTDVAESARQLAGILFSALSSDPVSGGAVVAVSVPYVCELPAERATRGVTPADRRSERCVQTNATAQRRAAAPEEAAQDTVTVYDIRIQSDGTEDTGDLKGALAKAETSPELLAIAGEVIATAEVAETAVQPQVPPPVTSPPVAAGSTTPPVAAGSTTPPAGVDTFIGSSDQPQVQPPKSGHPANGVVVGIVAVVGIAVVGTGVALFAYIRSRPRGQDAASLTGKDYRAAKGEDSPGGDTEEGRGVTV